MAGGDSTRLGSQRGRPDAAAQADDARSAGWPLARQQAALAPSLPPPWPACRKKLINVYSSINSSASGRRNKKRAPDARPAKGSAVEWPSWPAGESCRWLPASRLDLVMSGWQRNETFHTKVTT
jgi:hypothetical protein